jgi:glycosyltransferase involved in cell wall biosynthesis
MKKKITFMSIHAYPLFNKKYGGVFGGAEVQLYQLSKAINASGNFSVSFIVADVGQEKREIYDGIEVVRSYALGSRKIYKKIFKQLKFFFTLIGIGPDVLIQRAAGIETGLLAFYCKIFRKKFIYMAAHEIDCSGEYEKNNGIQGKSYAYGIRKASLIIVQNGEQQKLLKENYDLDSVVLKSSYEIPEQVNKDKRGFLWVARLDSWKQPEIYLDLARAFPAEEFTMVAPMANDVEYGNKIQKEALEIPNLKFVERVPFEQIGEYFQKAKVFIGTSKYEGFPNTYVQAVMCGTPIVSLSVNPDDFINKYECGYVAVNDQDEIKRQIKKLIDDKDDWNIKSSNAYQYAKDNHDIEKNVVRMMEMIRDVTGG